jgi:hypothetical protein
VRDPLAVLLISDVYTEGSKKCTHSLIVNIFGTKLHVVTILARRESEPLCVFEVTTISG